MKGISKSQRFCVIIRRPEYKGGEMAVGPYRKFGTACGDADAWNGRERECYVLPMTKPDEALAEIWK